MLDSIIQHVLVGTLCIIAPATSFFMLSRLKRNQLPGQKEKAYISIYIAYWTYTAILLLIYPAKELLFPKYPFHFPWWLSIPIVLVGVWGAAWTILPQLQFKSNEEVRNIIIENYKEEDHIFPKTLKQQRMMVSVAVTVGICEEIIFRGFINNYLHEQWGVSVHWSFVIAAIIFGLGHFSQGIGEMRDSTIFGLIMGFLYILTGSLLLPIILHIMYDLKIVTMTRIIQKYEQSGL